MVEILACGGEQAAPKTQTLEFRPQINLVDLAVVKQAACAVAPIVGIARDAIAELKDCNAAAFADGRIPPVRTTAVDQLVELIARDDALIGRAPRLIMGVGDVQCVCRLCATNLYEGRAHCAIEATNFAAFKPYRK